MTRENGRISCSERSDNGEASMLTKRDSAERVSECESQGDGSSAGAPREDGNAQLPTFNVQRSTARKDGRTEGRGIFHRSSVICHLSFGKSRPAPETLNPGRHGTGVQNEERQGGLFMRVGTPASSRRKWTAGCRPSQKQSARLSARKFISVYACIRI